MASRAGSGIDALPGVYLVVDSGVEDAAEQLRAWLLSCMLCLDSGCQPVRGLAAPGGVCRLSPSTLAPPVVNGSPIADV